MRWCWRYRMRFDLEAVKRSLRPATTSCARSRSPTKRLRRWSRRLSRPRRSSPCAAPRYTSTTSGSSTSGRRGRRRRRRGARPRAGRVDHFAHSFVRGARRREDESGPMPLTKACDDLAGEPCRRQAVVVGVFGSPTVFDGAHRPPGAADRRVSCDVEPTRPYSAPRLYHAWFAPARRSVLHVNRRARVHRRGRRRRLSRRAVRALRAWQRNDVCGHQAVSVEHQGGVTCRSR